MARIVMKFGGTSVADVKHIRNVAQHIKREVLAGNEIVVVVSAMAGKTNELLALAREASGNVKKALSDNAEKMIDREYDVILSSGEQITIGLLSLVLQNMGIAAHSWLGWQIPIQTDNNYRTARIKAINGAAIIAELEKKRVAIVAGFQGLSPDNNITTLGRGGSDTSAVAIAAAIKADRCDIYTDVDGVYTTDPRIEKKAVPLTKISFEEMLEMSSLGAKVLQVRSVELAMIHKVRTFVRSSFTKPDAKELLNDNISKGTLICDEDEIVEQQIVTGITFVKDEAKITLWDIADRPGISAAIFGALAKQSTNVDMIIQNISKDGSTTDMTFTVPSEDLNKAVQVLQNKQAEIGYSTMQYSDDLTKISIIGIGMRSHAGVAATAFEALAEKAINIKAITTSEIKISILIDSVYTELAVRTLHQVYNLAKEAN
ncbi:aspartate kinase [Bartonella sp. TP]|uniref:aspartate kinase n=1 Tax=Bartonella sp. TP TaxID=3057550 RepID=UPI0025AF1351|nr:aspartate kinase [Bartonella sp. TP]MDN5248871.1 aspartate kinase [Alphaproteobacteria bacterium]WJW79605.1 aspartate kinase [Bartonella sp. TP]